MGAKPRNTTTQKVRRLQVLDLSLAGASQRKIADTLKISKTTAKSDLDKALGDLAAEHHEEAAYFRAKQTKRYELLLSKVWDRATNGDLPYMDRCIALLGKIDSINGLSSEKSIALWVQQVNVQSSGLQTLADVAKRMAERESLTERIASYVPVVEEAMRLYEGKGGGSRMQEND